LAILALTLIIGVTLIIPIGGAVLPSCVELNSYFPGWAGRPWASFTLENIPDHPGPVGFAGSILIYIMSRR